METRSAKSSQKHSSKDANLAHPGSTKRLNVRKSFRTPVQTLPLSNEKSASRSYVVPAKQEDTETPRTLIAGLVESAETQLVTTRALRRRSSNVSQSPKPQKEFKSPRLSDILLKKIKNLESQPVSSPGSKVTPRTNVKNLLAGTEQEQTPLERTAREEHPPSDSIPSRVKRRESGWGQRLTISPVQVSLSINEDDNGEGATLLSARDKKTRRSFQFNKNVEAKLPKHLSKSSEKDTWDLGQETVEASGDESEDDPGVEEMEEKSSHQGKRHLSNSEKLSNLMSSHINEQNPSQPDSSQSSVDEQEVARPEGDFNEQDVNLSAKEKKTQETPSKMSLHQGLDSDEGDDILLQQRVITNVGGIDLSQPNEASKIGSMSTTLQRESSAGMHTQVSKVRTPIRNTSLLKAAEPLLSGPSASLRKHSEYDLMESSSEAETSLGHSKTPRTPKSKRKNTSKASSRANITKDELAEKYKSPSRSPGSPYRILRQSNADFRVIGQRCSTPLVRNKSFFHSTKVQDTLPQDLTQNQTHLMGDDIHNISPIRPDVRQQKRRNFDDELVDDVEPGNKQTEKSGTSSIRAQVSKADLPKGRVTESVAKENVNMSIGEMIATAGHPGSSKVADANSQQTTGTNRKRTLESDSDDELPDGLSPLKTPHFTTTKPQQISSAQNAPRMKQSTLVNQKGVLKTANQTQPKRAKTGEAKTTSTRQSKNQKRDLTLPRSSVKFFAERHSSMKLSKDAVDEIVRVSETYWKDTWKALEAYALHAGRKKIIEEDVILLMKTQRVITGIGDLHDKIREYLPMELRTELIPLNLSNL